MFCNISTVAQYLNPASRSGNKTHWFGKVVVWIEPHEGKYEQSRASIFHIQPKC